MERFITLIVTALVISVCCLASPTTNTARRELNNLLKNFPGYHLLTPEERDPDVKAFLEQHLRKDNPSMVFGDFNGDGHPDYALLLKDEKSGAAKLVVLLCAGEGQCKTVYQMDLSTYASTVYLTPLSTGSKISETGAVDGNTAPVKLRSIGIQVNYFEKGKVVLHWNPKHQKIEEIQTGD